MKKTVTISNKKSATTLIVEDFIDSPVGRDILLMTAYGPTQELRCFAQILGSKDGFLEITEGDNRILSINQAQCLQTMSIIHKPEHCYSALSIVPSTVSTIIGNSDEECYGIFSRILDQMEFVHRDWYRFVWDKVAISVTPQVGTRSCYIFTKSRIDEVVKGGLEYGGISMPAPTANLTMTVQQKP